MKQSTEGTIRRMAEREKMERDADHITCPYCDWVSEEPEDEYDFMSYHGESHGVFECPACEEKFTVEERVTRTFVTKQRQCAELELRDRVGWALSMTGGDKNKAAHYAGMSKKELRAVVTKHAIDWRDYGSGG